MALKVLPKQDLSIENKNPASVNNNFIRIPLECIDDNPLNEDYSQGDLEELKNSILNTKIVATLVVKKSEMINGMQHYMLISGHRRTNALRLMTKEELLTVTGKKGIQCEIVEPESAEHEKAMISIYNLDRVKSEGELFKTFLNIKAYYDTQNTYKHGNKLNALEAIAKQLNLSFNQVQKMAKIEAEGSDEILELVKSNKLGVYLARDISSMPKELQDIAGEIIQDEGSISKEQVNALKEEYKSALKEKENSIKDLTSEVEKLNTEIKELREQKTLEEEKLKIAKEAELTAIAEKYQAKLDELVEKMMSKEKESKQLDNKLEKEKNRVLKIDKQALYASKEEKKVSIALEKLEAAKKAFFNEANKELLKKDKKLQERLSELINEFVELEKEYKE